jgi:hypothetical protein
MDETRHALPVELAEPITLESTDTRAQLLAIGGVLLSLLVCLVGVIWCALLAVAPPAVLEGATYTLVGALAGMLVTRR